MSDPITQWTDDELQRALQRAWRESVRCWQEHRDHVGPMQTSATDETGRILHEGADSADRHYQHLLAERNRRTEERRQAGIAQHGQCSACSEPNAPGKDLCAGHVRMSSYDPGAEYAANH